MMRLKLAFGVVLLVCLATSAVWADSLELKNGSLIKGRFVGGTDTEITFQVGSSKQTYNVADIVSLKFDSDRGAPETSTIMPETPKSADGLVPRPPAKVEHVYTKPSRYVTVPAGTRISVRTIDAI